MFSDFPLSYLMPILFLAELKSSIIGKKKPTAAKKGVGGERQSCLGGCELELDSFSSSHVLASYMTDKGPNLSESCL